MNVQFSHAVTSTAFFLQLTRTQCNALLRVAEAMKRVPIGPPIDGKERTRTYSGLHTYAPGDVLVPVDVATLSPLKERGLVFWWTDTKGRPDGFGGLTRAGRLTVALLHEAGLTVENTNTPRVLARIQRAAA